MTRVAQVDLEEYQKEASLTEQAKGEKGLQIALMGLGGEVGTILSEFKKKLRDGESHEQFEATIAEELGDILWYISSIASHLSLDLNEIAVNNLVKLQERWPIEDRGQTRLALPPALPDVAFPTHEQLPRTFVYRFEESVEDGRRRVRVYDGSKDVGDPLSDNAHDDDGYRYHDVFHLAYAAVLGWSPVLRNMLKRKRRSSPLIDEIEDGGRSQVIEEGVAAFVFEYAQRHGYLQHTSILDYQLLKTVKALTARLEVSRCSAKDWERAILVGFRVWRELKQKRSGLVVGDLVARTLEFQEFEGLV